MKGKLLTALAALVACSSEPVNTPKNAFDARLLDDLADCYLDMSLAEFAAESESIEREVYSGPAHDDIAELVSIVSMGEPENVAIVSQILQEEVLVEYLKGQGHASVTWQDKDYNCDSSALTLAIVAEELLDVRPELILYGDTNWSPGHIQLDFDGQIFDNGKFVNYDGHLPTTRFPAEMFAIAYLKKQGYDTDVIAPCFDGLYNTGKKGKHIAQDGAVDSSRGYPDVKESFIPIPQDRKEELRERMRWSVIDLGEMTSIYENSNAATYLVERFPYTTPDGDLMLPIIGAGGKICCDSWSGNGVCTSEFEFLYVDLPQCYPIQVPADIVDAEISDSPTTAFSWDYPKWGYVLNGKCMDLSKNKGKTIEPFGIWQTVDICIPQ